MPVYEVACPNCGPQEIVARMSEAGPFMPCGVCGRDRPQVIHAPNFQEDRVRMWKGPHGNGYSHALGGFMPDSRQARDRMAKAKGVEFISLGEHLKENKDAAQAVEYKKHVDSGGARIEQPLPSTSAFVAKPKWAEGLV